VLVTETAMRRLARAEARHMEEVRRILDDGRQSCDVFRSCWALHHPDGNQTIVRFIDTSRTVEEAIKWATTQRKWEHEPLVFIAASMDEARQMADARHEALSDPDAEGGAA